MRSLRDLTGRKCGHASAILDGTRNVVKLVGDGKAFELSARRARLYAKLDDYLAGQHPKGTKKRASKPN